VSSCDPGPESTDGATDTDDGANPAGGTAGTGRSGARVCSGGPACSGDGANRLAAPLKKPPRPSSALPISLGTIQTLFASPWAICGSICMYW
jgi:hypothetical protein